MSVLADIKEAMQTLRAVEDIPELPTVMHTVESVSGILRGMQRKSCQQRLANLQLGDKVHIATILGTVSGTYVGDNSILSEATLVKGANGVRQYHIASRSPRTLVIANENIDGGVLGIDGTLHKDWITVPYESIQGIVVE